GPITCPRYLDRAQFVTRIDEERVTFAPNDRWAGSLRNQFERALSLRLMGALDTDDVATFPWWPGRRLDASVQLSVLAFEPDASGQARLGGVWKVEGGRRAGARARKRTDGRARAGRGSRPHEQPGADRRRGTRGRRGRARPSARPA